MKNPLIKRLPKELKDSFGIYLILFSFIVFMIAFVSGFMVAGSSMKRTSEESFEKYRVEDGNLEFKVKASEQLIDKLAEKDVLLYENFYVEETVAENDSTLRIFQKRKDVNLECLMEGAFPEKPLEIAVDRMYAANNKLKVGDTLTMDGRTYNISGLVSLSDYTALYQNPSDMMFDAVKFGVAIVSEQGFEALDPDGIHYNYSWIYTDWPREAPKATNEAKERAEELVMVAGLSAFLSRNEITGFLPAFANNAIIFAGDDIGSDAAMIEVFLYIIIAIVAFIFAITTTNTITRESNVIGTLRASGYTKGEVMRHYMAIPVAIMLSGALIGNILGYTFFVNVAANMYYESYSLPTFTPYLNYSVFVRTTLIPVILLLAIVYFTLKSKLNLSPLQLIRRQLNTRGQKKAFRLSTKISIMKRFRLRVFFQNLPSYLTIVFGIFLANIILLFALMLRPVLNNYQDIIIDSMLCSHQYVLNHMVETEDTQAEKYTAGTLKTIEGKHISEQVLLFGIEKDSAYVDLEIPQGQVFVSTAYASKHHLKVGEEITLQESFGEETHTFRVDGIYEYPASLALFMNRADLNEFLGEKEDYFNGYFSNHELEDLTRADISMMVTKTDLTKTTRQLEVSIGTLMGYVMAFSVIMYVMIIWLLARIIIERNSQSISMTKILGYTQQEINGLYIRTTTLVVLGALAVTTPVCNLLMKILCEVIFGMFPGFLPYVVPVSVFVKIFALGIVSYLAVMMLLVGKVRKVPMAEALKHVE